MNARTDDRRPPKATPSYPNKVNTTSNSQVEQAQTQPRADLSQRGDGRTARARGEPVLASFHFAGSDGLRSDEQGGSQCCYGMVRNLSITPLLNNLAFD
jgi:hypothetical protein